MFQLYLMLMFLSENTWLGFISFVLGIGKYIFALKHVQVPGKHAYNIFYLDVHNKKVTSSSEQTFGRYTLSTQNKIRHVLAHVDK